MERKIIYKLRQWKDNPQRKPLILLGARQVGKTWIMKHFGETDFENVAYINCDAEPMAKELFAADYDIDRLLLMLQAITGTKIEAGKTLIILDELQEVERGMHSLKYFYDNAPEYHVIAAGSLLEAKTRCMCGVQGRRSIFLHPAFISNGPMANRFKSTNSI